MFSDSTLKKIGCFAGGVVFGTAGVKLLSSKDAKKVYTNCTAAVLRAKDCVMKTVTTVQENAEDILAEAHRSMKSVRRKRQCRCRKMMFRRMVRLNRKKTNR